MMFLVLHDQPAFIEDRNPLGKPHVKGQEPEHECSSSSPPTL